jgi:hypothetical protein
MVAMLTTSLESISITTKEESEKYSTLLQGTRQYRLAQSIHIVQELGDIVGLLTWMKPASARNCTPLPRAGQCQ